MQHRSKNRGHRARASLAGPLALAVGAGLALAVGGAGTAQAVEDRNVARNAGFESGLTGWTCSANSGSTVTSPSAAAPPR